MISPKQIERTLGKLRRLEVTLEQLLFKPVAQVKMEYFQTPEQLCEIPGRENFTPCYPGMEWGGEWNYCWFRGTFIPDEQLEGQTLYLYPKTTGYEALLWVDGEPFGIFASKLVVNSHGNHYCDMLCKTAKAGQSMDIALEYYAGHYCAGTVPLTDENGLDFSYQIGTFDVCLKDEEIGRFLFDLKTLNQLVAVLEESSFRRAEVIRTLLRVHEEVRYSFEDAGREAFMEGLRGAQPHLTAALSRRNGDTAPFAGLIGHSHMDTAWLWTRDETLKKCARTYSNQMSLMEQYPEYGFIQSSAYHSALMERHYPRLFERMSERIAQGRYEPNGGVWVECDCNIVTGEMMARQFVWGQRYTRQRFGYTSDVFWLPDTFGYSAAIPQIMKLAEIKYFLTTKMAWNDTNPFPYDTFWWRGMDGTRVLTHLNRTHIWPSPESLMEYVVDGKRTGDCIREKAVSDKRLISFGFGDGGGGPQFEMLEMARRLEDLEGLPRSGYRTVSRFMQELEEGLTQPTTYSGELYLELHRGVLTNQHTIKRNNRLAEIALHNLEYLTVYQAMCQGKPALHGDLDGLVETLLVNQFHDILPGTSIPQVHQRAIRETGELIEKASDQARALMETEGHPGLTLINTAPFKRTDTIYLPKEWESIQGAACQKVDTLLDGECIAVDGLEIEAYGGIALSPGTAVSERGMEPPILEEESPFRLENNTLSTPFYQVIFDDNGSICSLLDRRAHDRQLCGSGYALNTFLLGEDVPLAWDNWDIDADIELKLKPGGQLIERHLVSQGPVELRIRSKYQLTQRSTLTQDMVFYAKSPMIRFDTLVDWQDHHLLLKTAFDTGLDCCEARFETQFGYVKRPNTRSNDLEKAKFEVCCHKYADLSETSYGVALLNDCKYGISAEEGRLRLTLHKGGNRPDDQGDLGLHAMTYAFLPHNAPFGADNVVRMGYLLNYKPVMVQGNVAPKALVQLDAGSVLVETVKPCEDEACAFILRLYECEGSTEHAQLSIPGAKEIVQTNLLEDPVGAKTEDDHMALTFRPFEIKTLKVSY